MEVYSAEEFRTRVKSLPLAGSGLPELDKAHAQKRPVILISAHFGNYEAFRVGLLERGFAVGGLYRPMSNPLTSEAYVKQIEAIGKPVFPRGHTGLGAMIRFLRSGGMMGMLVDLHVGEGERLDFLGKPAMTSIAAAKMALKYNALLVPLYAVRTPDGLSFSIEVEAPIPHSDAITMTQALNDSMSSQITRNMGQWNWMHRRWK